MIRKIPDLTLKKLLVEQYPLEVTKLHVAKIAHLCMSFEIRQDHPLALNSQYLGVHKVVFTDKDQDTLFIDIFGVGRASFNTALQAVPIIDPKKRKVWSNPYSIFTIWVAHCILTSHKLTMQEKEVGLFHLFKLWNYKYFTSMVNQKFRYGTDEATMRAVVESLNNKFDVIRLGSWKAVIEERAKDLYSASSIHLKTLQTFQPDKDITYAITDTSTRMKSKINLITDIFHQFKRQGKNIRRYTTTDTINGEKLLKDLNNSLDGAVSRLSTQLPNQHQFIDTEQIDVIATIIKVKPKLLKDTLKYMSDLAAQQLHQRATEDVLTNNDKELIIGCRKLAETIIHVTFRKCILEGVDITSKYNILVKTANMYRSSQILDPDIAQIKDSVWYMLEGFRGTTREGTKLTLRIGVILYLILRALNYV